MQPSDCFDLLDDCSLNPLLQPRSLATPLSKLAKVAPLRMLPVVPLDVRQCWLAGTGDWSAYHSQLSQLDIPDQRERSTCLGWDSDDCRE